MKKLFKTILVGAGLITALAPQVAQSSQSYTIVERQAINEIKLRAKHTITNHIGGLPLVTEYYGNSPGLTPKEYGIRYGNDNSRKYRSNRLLTAKCVKQKHRCHS